MRVQIVAPSFTVVRVLPHAITYLHMNMLDWGEPSYTLEAGHSGVMTSCVRVQLIREAQ